MKDEERREHEKRRIVQLRNKYVLKARRGMTGPDMHRELRTDDIGEPALTDLQIAAIVAYAFHPFNNPHMLAREWEFNDLPQAKVPL